MTPPVRPESLTERRRQLIAAYKQALDEGMDKDEAYGLFRSKLSEMAPGGGADLKPYGMVNAALQGASFGFSDEIAGAGRALIDKLKGESGTLGELTQSRIAQERERMDAYRKENPGTSFATELAGGMLMPLGAAKGAGAMVKAAGKTLPRQMAAAAGTGAVTGALSGYGASEGDNAVSQTVTGGVLGGVLGGALPVVSAGGGRMLDMIGARPVTQKKVAENALSPVRLMDRAAGEDVTEPTIRQKVAKMFGAEPVENRAKIYVARTVGKDNQTLAKVAANADLAGDKPLMLPDFLGETGKKAIRAVRTVDETGQIDDALERRAMGAPSRVANDVMRAGGEKQSVARMLDAAEQTRKEFTAPLYDQALDGVNIQDGRFLDFLKRPSMRAGYEEARRMAQNAGEDMPAIERLMGRAASNLDDETVGGVATRRAGRADAAGVGVMDMTQDQLRGVRRSGALETMTNADLEAERLYLLQEQGADQARAAIRELPDYAEYLALRDAGNFEDARGVLERMGYNDLREFNQNIGRDAAKAASNLKDRAEKIAAVEAEMQRRAAMGPERTIPGRGNFSVPDAAEVPTVPTLTGKQVQWWKLALDDEIARLEGQSGGTSTTKYRQAVQMRDELDNMLYEFGNTNSNGETLWAGAQGEYSKLSAPIDAAKMAKQGIPERFIPSASNAQPEQIDYALEQATRKGRNPEAGTAYRAAGLEDYYNKIQQAGKTNQNRSAMMFSDPTERAKLNRLMKPDADRVALNKNLDTEEAMARTKSFVQRGSQTPLIQEEAQQFKDATSVAEAMAQGPKALATWAWREAAARGGRGLSRDIAAEVSRVSTLPPAELSKFLKDLEKWMTDRAVQQAGKAAAKGARAGAFTGAVSRSQQ